MNNRIEEHQISWTNGNSRASLSVVLDRITDRVFMRVKYKDENGWKKERDFDSVKEAEAAYNSALEQDRQGEEVSE